MSARPMRQRPLSGREHERARDLASLRLDEPLADADASWLDAHLAGCGACAASALGYAEMRSAFAGLRASAPEPPRDLWARTSAQIEAEAARRPRRDPAPRPTPRPMRPGRFALSLFAPLTAVLVVAVAVGTGLLNGTPLLPPGTAALPTPIAITAAADVQVLSRSEDGSVQLVSRPVTAVCPAGSSECGVKRTFAVTNVAGVSGGSLKAAMSPRRDGLVVVASSNGTQGVYVLPITVPAAAPSVDATPDATGAGGGTASTLPASPVVIATGSPAVASASPSAGGSGEPVVSPSIAVSPEPGGVLEIASNVVVVGAAAYSPDGTQVAFSARPADGSAGPDVYLWTTGDAVARALTTDHAARFASWTTAGILVSRAAEGTPATTLLDPVAGTETPVEIGAAWLPTVDPTGTVGAWWSGTVRQDAAGDWVPDAGNLVIGPWPAAAGAGAVAPTPEPTAGATETPASSAGASGPDGATVAPDASSGSSAAASPEASAAPSHTPSSKPTADASAPSSASSSPAASPAASPGASAVPEGVQVLTRGALLAWAVRWDETGTAMAVWTLGAERAPSSGAPSEAPGASASGVAAASAEAASAAASAAAAASASAAADASATPRVAPDTIPTSVDPVPSHRVVAQPSGLLPAETAATGTPAPTPEGRLSLYRVDPATRLADLARPMLDAAPADGGFSLRTGRLAWTGRASSGEVVVQVLAWSGEAVGRLELPAAMGAMIVP